MKSKIFLEPEPIVSVREVYSNGAVYTGQMKNGKKHGRGVFKFPGGGAYDGEWNDNQMDGFGSLYYKNGKLAYQGSFSMNKFHGKGEIYNEHVETLFVAFDYQNLDKVGNYWFKYEGEFTQDSKGPFGVLYLSNGESYQGEFKQNMAHGKGSFKRLDGSIKKGTWLKNRLMVAL